MVSGGGERAIGCGGCEARRWRVWLRVEVVCVDLLTCGAICLRWRSGSGGVEGWVLLSYVVRCRRGVEWLWSWTLGWGERCGWLVGWSKARLLTARS